MENQKFKILLIGIGENNQNLRIPKSPRFLLLLR